MRYSVLGVQAVKLQVCRHESLDIVLGNSVEAMENTCCVSDIKINTRFVIRKIPPGSIN